MGKARNSVDPNKPQFSQAELCEVAEIPVATANNWILTGALRPADVGKAQSSQAETVFGRHDLCRRSSDQASRSLAARLQGGQFEDAFARFLTTQAEHPNTQAWGRRKDVKVFGCSDDCARCGTGRAIRPK
jgi:hypothetical protein